jgi:hypothetical protein
MPRLRAILVLRAALATAFVVLGIVVIAAGEPVFGALAIAFGISNGVLVAYLRRRSAGPAPTEGVVPPRS